MLLVSLVDMPILLLGSDFRVLLQLNNLELAVSLAKRGNLPGAENLVNLLFVKLL